MRLGVSIQHVFLMFVSWLYIVVLVNSIGGTATQTEDLIRMSMIAAGVGTILMGTRGVFRSGYFVLSQAVSLTCHPRFWRCRPADFLYSSEWSLSQERSPAHCRE